MIEENCITWDEDVSSNAVEVHIHHLRRKLGRGLSKLFTVSVMSGKMMKTYSLRLRLARIIAAAHPADQVVASVFPDADHKIHQ